MMRYLIPLFAFLVLAAFLLVGLTLNPRQVPSPLIDKPAPKFQLNQLQESDKVMSSDDNLGKVWMLNVWASWCVACR
ncbi:MAG: DsbE family thiol:disulfide interchange protein, partial [Betaproteobacteria bacterium]|nr:DsbE family thiol:disulfide interchange protein [Betaproteobacteria bacterium]